MMNTAWEQVFLWIQAKLLHRAFPLLHSLFYQFWFARQGPLSAAIAHWMRMLESQEGKGDIPLSAEAWDGQYQAGVWNYMENLEECSRYSPIVGYMAYLKPGGSILDVGCGAGVLYKKYQPYGYAFYQGIDISATAIATLTQVPSANSLFIQADAETYEPHQQFDVIIFNEVLYYFEDPLATFSRYSYFLNPEGVFIISTYKGSRRAMGVLRRLKTSYALLNETKTIHAPSSKCWICSVFLAHSPGHQ
jgi:2-polyprenyl-3-methyl-5-hydroxy-6-metoxy-1,4-benzoquinol methylase